MASITQAQMSAALRALADALREEPEFSYSDDGEQRLLTLLEASIGQDAAAVLRVAVDVAKEAVHKVKELRADSVRLRAEAATAAEQATELQALRGEVARLRLETAQQRAEVANAVVLTGAAWDAQVANTDFWISEKKRLEELATSAQRSADHFRDYSDEQARRIYALEDELDQIRGLLGRREVDLQAMKASQNIHHFFKAVVDEVEFYVNLRGDAFSYDTFEWFGHFDGVKVDTSAEQPVDLNEEEMLFH
jgi:hypothetical protein